MFLFTMVGFEVLNDMTVFRDIESVETADVEDLNEKYKGERESESETESKSEIELTFHDLRDLSFIREKIKTITIFAHDINYLLLEQKIIIPPPEFCFS